MNDPLLKAKALQKIKELDPKVQDPACAACNEHWSQGLLCNYAEAYRSQQRQDYLWTINRTKGPWGQYKTWTRNSLHTKRLAIDIYPVGWNGTIEAFYDALDSVMEKYGIYRPPELIAKGDLGHYQYDKAYYPPVQVDPEQKLRRLKLQVSQLKKRMLRTQDTEILKDIALTIETISGQIERLEKRITS